MANLLKKSIILSVFLLIATSVVQAKDVMVIKYATANPKGSAHVTFAEKFKELTENYSKGRMQVDLHIDGKLGSEQDNVMDVSSGEIQMSTVSVNNVAPYAPVLGFTSLPYVFPKISQAYKLFTDPLMDEINREMVKTANIRSLSWIILGGYRLLHNTKKEVCSPDDLKGLKIRVPETALIIATYRAWGIEPIPLAWTQMYDALKTGKVDGGANPANVIKSSKFYTVEKYLTNLHDNLGMAPLLVNEDFYQNLPRKQQSVLAKAAKEAAEFEWKWNEKENEKNLQWLLNQGMVLVEPADNETEWIKRARSIWPQFYDEIGGQKFLNRVMEVLEGTPKPEGKKG